MNEEIKQRWVTALRSGDYEQTSCLLGFPDQNKFCCLGVLCEIALEDGIVTRGIDPDERTAIYLTVGITRPQEGQDFSDTHLPLSVRRWAELDLISTDVDVRDSRSRVSATLTSRNDSGWSFGDIADLIEREL